ncbi:MAG: hypothetical protein H0W02_04290 [Ktedonobacteraceae bacterium]|nr:hypothetical protein [Ktedonobacteraceae bacterium]
MSGESESLESFLEKYYSSMVQKEFGNMGVSVLEDLIKGVRSIYQFIEPSICNFSIVVFKTLDENTEPIHRPEPFILDDYQLLTQIIDQECIIRLNANGQLHVWKHHQIDLSFLSKIAVVYQYNNRQECFFANSAFQRVPKLSASQASTFASDTFDELLQALDAYKTEQVRYSSCPILQEIWKESNRLFLKNAPEHYMRNSLTHFLKIRLRNYKEVRPEQVIDDSHPADIKVTWFLTNRLALIEIKWLGTSMKPDGNIAQKYTDYRAREGAKQLAEYLEGNLQQAPIHITRGYLVIIDCRRAKLTKMMTAINQRDGTYYRDQEINFDPCYHEKRRDFEKPIRMFVEPKCI